MSVADLPETDRLRFERTEFLGLGFANATAAELLAALAARPPDAEFAYVVTPNVDHMVRLAEGTGRDRDSAEVWAAYRGAALVLCDSRVLMLLARLRGVLLPVVPGSDLTARLLGDVARPGDRIALIGGNAAMLAALARLYPRLRFHQHVPPMGLRSNRAAMDEAASFACAMPARFCFIAVGSPQQELLAARIKEKGGAQGIGLCVGASFDFLVGAEPRAPLLVRKLALEWLYRLANNPRRLWRRYLVEGPRILRLVARWKRPGR